MDLFKTVLIRLLHVKCLEQQDGECANMIIIASELPLKIFTDSGKFTNVHAKNIHIYRPVQAYNSENKCFLPIITAKAVVYIHINLHELSYAA